MYKYRRRSQSRETVSETSYKIIHERYNAIVKSGKERKLKVYKMYR